MIAQIRRQEDERWIKASEVGNFTPSEKTGLASTVLDQDKKVDCQFLKDLKVALDIVKGVVGDYFDEYFKK